MIEWVYRMLPEKISRTQFEKFSTWLIQERAHQDQMIWQRKCEGEPEEKLLAELTEIQREFFAAMDEAFESIDEPLQEGPWLHK